MFDLLDPENTGGLAMEEWVGISLILIPSVCVFLMCLPNRLHPCYMRSIQIHIITYEYVCTST